MTKVSVVIEMLSDYQTNEVVKLLSCMDLSDPAQPGMKAKIWSPDRVFRKKTGSAHYKSMTDLSNQLLAENINSVEWRLDKESDQLQLVGTVISEIVFNLQVSPTCSLWNAIGDQKKMEGLNEQVRLSHSSYEEALVLRGIKRFPTSLICTFELDLAVEKNELFINIINFLHGVLQIENLAVLSCARIILIFGGRFLGHQLANILFNASAEYNEVRNLIIEFAPILILKYSLCEKIMARMSQLSPIPDIDKCLYQVPSRELDLGIVNLYPFIKNCGIIDVKYALHDMTFKMPEMDGHKMKTK